MRSQRVRVKKCANVDTRPLIAAPSLAQTAPASRPAFDHLDRDHDGLLSFEEFRAR